MLNKLKPDKNLPNIKMYSLELKVKLNIYKKLTSDFNTSNIQELYLMYN